MSVNVSIRKNKGQYMTPAPITTMILDTIGYTGPQILTKTIMEPSFGDGSFLISIVQRVIIEGKRVGLSKSDIAQIINNNIFGIEKDILLYNRAIERLHKLLDTHGIQNVRWNHLICGDTLIAYKAYAGKMDYVVGNPPYIRIHNIPEDYREIIKEFRFIDGMIDLYIVFYEIGLLLLNDTGKLGYIAPNSFMKNTSQKAFRNYLVENKYISAIYDFKTSKIFEDADTYTCICILDKNKNRYDFSIDYKEFSMYEMVAANHFDYAYFRDELRDKAWNLSADGDIKFLEENKNLPTKIQDIAVVQNGIATNKDAIYIIHAYLDKELSVPYMGKHTDMQRNVYFCDKDGNIRTIESTILHRCVKASKYNGIMDNTYVIFPYEKNQPFTEEELKQSFPNAYNYFISFKAELSTRDMDENLPWFLFGRSQGLQNSCYKKIVFKHVINKVAPVIEPHILDEDVIVYSGMYTTTKQEQLEEISDIFASANFAKYCSIIGKDMSGGYVSISTKMVKQFGIGE